MNLLSKIEDIITVQVKKAVAQEFAQILENIANTEQNDSQKPASNDEVHQDSATAQSLQQQNDEQNFESQETPGRSNNQSALCGDTAIDNGDTQTVESEPSANTPITCNNNESISKTPMSEYKGSLKILGEAVMESLESEIDQIGQMGSNVSQLTTTTLNADEENSIEDDWERKYQDELKEEENETSCQHGLSSGGDESGKEETGILPPSGEEGDEAASVASRTRNRIRAAEATADQSATNQNSADFHPEKDYKGTKLKE